MSAVFDPAPNLLALNSVDPQILELLGQSAAELDQMIRNIIIKTATM